MLMSEMVAKGLTGSDALEMARRGSCDSVETRGRLTSARILADLIAAFAHTKGGCIIFGYHTRHKKVVGCNQNRLRRRHDEAEAILGNSQISSIYFHQVHGHQLGVIYVPAVDRLVDSPGGLVVRVDTYVRSMPRGQVIEILHKTRTRMSVEDYGTMLFQLQQRVEETGDSIRRNSSWWTKAKEQVLGFAIGSGLAALVAMAVAKFR